MKVDIEKKGSSVNEIGMYGVFWAVKSYRWIWLWTGNSTILLHLIPFDLVGYDLLFICSPIHRSQYMTWMTYYSM